ncbi:MAG: thioredoxin fold domain-containing protein [Puniceicoccales bacterium]|jgi:thiol-disulfide isomerase/thioredoxin|nr:thioredoxin fold domain-containing protein [Puniceicoccales bacterium]
MKKTLLLFALLFSTVSLVQAAPAKPTTPSTQSSAKSSEAIKSETYHTKLLDKVKSALVRAKKTSVVSLKQEEVNALRQKKYLFIYFSASWCGPCRRFTPELVKFYNEYYKKNGDFDILLVSSDRSQEKMNAYMKEEKMPWAGIKLTHAMTNGLAKQHKVSGIPRLVLLGEKDEVLANGQGDAINKYAELRAAASSAPTSQNK